MAHGIALVSGLDYGRLDGIWDELLAPLDLGDLTKKKVLLKPNLMLAADPEAGTCTHPAFVISLAGHLASRGARVLAGDSSGALGLTTVGADRIGLISGLDAAGARFVDFDRCPIELKRVDSAVLHEVALPRPLLEADLVINVPKLKTHTLTGLSCAIKNSMGCLPGGLKPLAHARIGGRMRDLAALLADLCAAIGFAGHVMDAIVVREGGGSQKGKTRRLGVVAASKDPVMLDSLAARLAGWEPSAIPTIAAAEAAGLGTSDLQAAIDASSIPAANPPLSMPGFDPKRIAFVGRLAYAVRARAVRPVVLKPDPGCGTTELIGICPWQAITAPPLRIDRKLCTSCLVCAALCPGNAIGLRVAWPLRRAFSKRAAGLAPGGMLR